MGRFGCLVVAVLLVSAAAAKHADGATIRFNSEVPRKEWTGAIQGVLVTPRGKGPFPTVVLLHPCAGLLPMVRGSLDAHARYLARNGFASLVLDSFGPRRLNGGKACQPPLARTATALLLYDAFNAKAALARNSAVDRENIYVAGQSLGGSAALMAASRFHSTHADAFRAAAAWYPRCRTILHSDEFKSPVLVLGAGKDDWQPPQGCVDAKRSGRLKGAAFEVIVYPDALHGFDVPRNRPQRFQGHLLGHSARDTEAARKAMLEFFKAHMKK